MRNVTGDKDWYCKDKKMVSDYFEESCFANNLYSLCPNGSNGKHIFSNRNYTTIILLHLRVE